MPVTDAEYKAMTLEQKETYVRQLHRSRPCMNCGKMESHWVGPSLGEPGFWICEANGEEQ